MTVRIESTWRERFVIAHGFHLEMRGNVPVVESYSGGCHPATAQEVAMWNDLVDSSTLRR